MNYKNIHQLARKSAAVLVGLIVFSSPAHALSISVTPANSTANLSDGTITLELFMDFTGSPTIGGGIDLTFGGAISFLSFTPSPYFNTVPAAPLTGFGTALADGDLEIHFGTFDFANGLGAVNKLGDLTVNLLGLGTGTIDIAINTAFGNFFDLNSQIQSVILNGAQVNVVPIPASFLLFSSALAMLGWTKRRVILAAGSGNAADIGQKLFV